MKCFIHVGRHKTGTTSIQSTLQSNYDELARRGVLYPRAGREAGQRHFHHPIVDALLADDGPAIARFRTELADEIAAVEPHTAILSSEALSRESVGAHHLRRLKECVPSDEVVAIVTLRRQDEMLLSRYAERVKVGVIRWPYSIFDLERDIVLDYDRITRELVEVFGRERVVVKLFETVKRDLVGDFLRECGVDPNGIALRDDRQNARMLWSVLAVKRFANTLPKPLQPIVSRGSRAIDRWARRRGWGAVLDRRAPLGTAERERLLGAYLPSNRKVEAEFFGGAEVFPRPRPVADRAVLTTRMEAAR